TAGHAVLAYAAAHLCGQITPQIAPIVPPALVFGVVFVVLRVALWYLAERLDVSVVPVQVEKPEFLLSLPLAPIGLRPLVAGERAGMTIQRLVENLLQLSRLEGSDELPTAEPVQIPSIVNQVIADLAPLAKQKHQTLSFEPRRDLEPALAVPLLLREALSNLVSNAVKYTPEGGEIGVWAERGRAP